MNEHLVKIFCLALAEYSKIEAMKAENSVKIMNNESLVYPESDFYSISNTLENLANSTSNDKLKSNDKSNLNEIATINILKNQKVNSFKDLYAKYRAYCVKNNIKPSAKTTYKNVVDRMVRDAKIKEDRNKTSIEYSL